jgi:hypothetical protein
MVQCVPHCFSDSVDDIGLAGVAAEFAARSACERSAGQDGLLTSAVAALGPSVFASSIIATPDMICPDAQNRRTVAPPRLVTRHLVLIQKRSSSPSRDRCSSLSTIRTRSAIDRALILAIIRLL